MIYVYPVGSTDFKTRGLGSFDKPLSATVTWAQNSVYDLEVEIDNTDRMIDMIQPGIILKAETATTPQPFEIYKIDPMLKTTKIYAKHLLIQKLSRDFVVFKWIKDRTGTNALRELLDVSELDSSQITVTGSNARVSSSKLVRRNLIHCLYGDEDNSFVNRWGGVFTFDNLNIDYSENPGKLRKNYLKIGKNVTGLTVEIDNSTVVTRIMPQGFDEIILDELYVVSPLEAELGFVAIKKIEFPDIKSMESEFSKDEGLPPEEAKQKLREAAQKLFNNGIDRPQVTANIDFIELSQLEEYSDIQALERLQPNDELTFLLDKPSMEIKAQFTAYSFNALLKRYNNITLGTENNTLSYSFSKINAVAKDLGNLINEIPSVITESKNQASELIKLGFGGHVYVQPNEIFIMDTDSKLTAKRVWRWNVNGLGYSSTGIAGPYGLAMTADGQIVADFITTGSLNADLIKTGLLSSVDGSSWINMNDGTFNLKNYIRVENGYLYVGRPEDDIVLRIGNNRLSFMSGDAESAYISDNILYITNAMFLQQLIIGNFGFIPRTNGNLSFVRVK